MTELYAEKMTIVASRLFVKLADTAHTIRNRYKISLKISMVSLSYHMRTLRRSEPGPVSPAFAACHLRSGAS